MGRPPRCGTTIERLDWRWARIVWWEGERMHTPLPRGEGGRRPGEGINCGQYGFPHPALRATFSLREKESQKASSHSAHTQICCMNDVILRRNEERNSCRATRSPMEFRDSPCVSIRLHIPGTLRDGDPDYRQPHSHSRSFLSRIRLALADARNHVLVWQGYTRHPDSAHLCRQQPRLRLLLGPGFLAADRFNHRHSRLVTTRSQTR